MELAAVLRHSWECPKPYGDRRRQAQGTLPEPLEEVSEPQVGAVTVGFVAAPGPLLMVATKWTPPPSPTS